MAGTPGLWVQRAGAAGGHKETPLPGWEHHVPYVA